MQLAHVLTQVMPRVQSLILTRLETARRLRLHEKYTKRLNNDNIKEDSITYRPWSQYDGIVGAEESETQVSAVVAEMTVNRLFANKKPRLKVYNNENGKLVFNIPLVDYALLVKGNYNKDMTDQDYLDRQDEYSFVFFVDDGMNWLSASIFVNSWRVVLQNVDM